MKEQTLLDFLRLAEKLKCNTRHSWTTSGRKESVAEHVYGLMVFAWLVKEEFPDLNMNRVMELALFHDMGEAVTGDIPAFEKKESHEKTEEEALGKIADMLPEPEKGQLQSIFKEVVKKQTTESKLLQALDKMEALIQHNEADISTWLPLEYDLQLTYGQEQTKDIPYMKRLRAQVYDDSVRKMENAKHRKEEKQKKAEEKKRRGKALKERGFTVRSDKMPDIEEAAALMRQSYWAKERPAEMIQKAMEHSKVYSVYDPEGALKGYARVLTDETTVFYLCDVIIDEHLRGQGLGTLMMDKIMEDVGRLHGVLHTIDAQEFYGAYGFGRREERLESIMEKERDCR